MIMLEITFNNNLLLYYISVVIKLASDFSPIQDRVHIHTDQLSHPPQPTTALEFSTRRDSCVQTPRSSVAVAVWNGPKMSPGIIPAMNSAILPQGSAWGWGLLCLRSTAALENFPHETSLKSIIATAPHAVL